MNHIFDPFYATREVRQGVGLGLSAVYDIVKNNSGDIQVSAELGVGAAFTLSFPKSEENS